jgi:hypothetical protein
MKYARELLAKSASGEPLQQEPDNMDADSDEVAQAIRDNVAQGYEMIR